MLQSSIDWRMTLFFLSGMLVCIPIFKALCLYRLRTRVRDRSPFYLLAPVLTPNRLADSHVADRAEIQTTLVKAGVASIALFLTYQFYWALVASFTIPPLALSYLAAPLVYLWGEAAGPVMQVVYAPTGRLPPPVHRSPLLASHITEFWGSRWNRWIRDFFHTTTLWPLRRQPVLGLALVFFFSGLLHEVMINLPLYAITGTNLFGSQMLYFSLQGFAVYVDRHYFYRHPRGRRLWLWSAVFLPAPLIVNEGLLRILHLWPPM